MIIPITMVPTVESALSARIQQGDSPQLIDTGHAGYAQTIENAESVGGKHEFQRHG